MNSKIEELISQVQSFKSYPHLRYVHSYTKLKEEVLDCSDEALEQMQADWDEVDKYNRETAAANRRLFHQAVECLEQLFAAMVLPTYKISKHHKILGEFKIFKEVKAAMESQMKTYCMKDKPYFSAVQVGEEAIGMNYSPITFVNLVKGVREKIKKSQEVLDRKQRIFRTCLILAEKYGIDPMDKDVVEKVTNAQRDEYVQKNYPDGTLMNFDGCNECSSWVVGERRCSCGNRRVSLTVEGDFDNWWAYPEAY